MDRTDDWRLSWQMVANIGVCLCNFWILNQKWQQTSKTTLFSSMELRGKGLIFKIVQQNNVSVTSVSVYYFVLFSPFCPLLFFTFAVNKTSQGQKKTRNAAQKLSIALRNRSWTSIHPLKQGDRGSLSQTRSQWTWLSCTPYIQTSFVGLTRTSPSSIEHLQKDTGKDHTFGDLIRKTVWCDPLSSEDLKMTFQFFQINQIKISFRWWPCIFNDSTVAIQRYIIIFCVTSWPFSCFAKHVIKN